jgi:hypothetical protein
MTRSLVRSPQRAWNLRNVKTYRLIAHTSEKELKMDILLRARLLTLI